MCPPRSDNPGHRTDYGCEADTFIADGVGDLHLAVCRRFGEAVRAADGKWERPTPCEAWDARAVLEHVIGFHDVLLLRPLGLKPERPRDDPLRRWTLTYDHLVMAFELDISRDAASMLPNVTRDVLVHTWDLARAVSADDDLDGEWCEHFYAALSREPMAPSTSKMFGAPVQVSSESDMQSKLLARLGRDPIWRPPSG